MVATFGPSQLREPPALVKPDDPSNAPSHTLDPKWRQTDFLPPAATVGSAVPAMLALRQKQTLRERHGHLSFSRLKLMAQAGLIPRELAHVPPPKCPGCAYGKAHRNPILWRQEAQPLSDAATEPTPCVDATVTTLSQSRCHPAPFLCLFAFRPT